MPSSSGVGISSRDILNIWRYAVATDFHAIDTSVETDTRLLGHGTEDRFLPFDPPIGKSCFTYSIDASGQWLAISNDNNVDIYNVESGGRTVLQGHTSLVREIGFSPTDPNVLVSLVEREGYDDNDDENEILIWDVEEQRLAEQSRTPIAIDAAAKVGVAAAIAYLGGTVQLSSQDSEEMEEALKWIMEQIDTRSRVPHSSRLNGRISTYFNSPLFSNSGDYLIYLPGLRPESNGDDTWDICLHNLVKPFITTLSGHRDSIMWIGFSPDDTLVASVGWDGFFRVHDVSGKEVWKWDKEHQNWAAVFSPDSKYLAGTDGVGIVRIWNLETGEETAKFDNGPRWCRTIDWSPNGKHIVVGSEAHGRLRLFAFADGKTETTQERILSTKNSKLDRLDQVFEVWSVE